MHGDLNGANILVDSEEVVWVIDFATLEQGHSLKDLAKLESIILFEYTALRDAYASIDKAIEHKVHNIFAAGDLIDVRRPPSEVAEFLRTQLDRLATISFRYIQGQHELSSPPWLSAISDNVQHLDGREPVNVYGTGGMSLIGIDWQPADKLAEKLEAIPDDVDILMAHQVWEDFMGL